MYHLIFTLLLWAVILPLVLASAVLFLLRRMPYTRDKEWPLLRHVLRDHVVSAAGAGRYGLLRGAAAVGSARRKTPEPAPQAEMRAPRSGPEPVRERRARAVPAAPPARPRSDPRAAGRPSPAGAGAAGASAVLNAPIPPAWMALIEEITSFEPEDWEQHMEFFSGNVAGILGLADAYRAYGDTQLNVIGLDPAAAQATLDMADSCGDFAHDVVMAQRIAVTIYQEILRAVEDGLVLPHNARQWLGGDTAGGAGRAA